jgi:hypothetical protein
VVGSLSGWAIASTPRGAAALCPNWAKNGPHANESYLVQTGRNSERTINDEVFDPGASRALREEYQNHFDAEEARSNAGLVSQVEDKSRFAIMKDYAKRAFDTMSKIRLKNEGDKISRYAQNASNLPKEPIAVAVLAASLYTGRSMAFRVFGGTRVESRVVLKDHVGQVTLPIASTGITTTLAYNHAGEVCAESNGCALLSKELVPNVSAVLNSAQKGTARVVYSISF